MEMQRALYFDCASGISGDMTLGALLDLGADEGEFLHQLSLLGLKEYHIEISETEKNGIRAKHVDVILREHEESEEYHSEQEQNEDEHDDHHEQHDDENHRHHHRHHRHHHRHHHHHHHHGRNFADIRRIIENSSLTDDVKDLALRIFLRVAQAEAKVHGKAVEEVHFHEVGAVDSIVDIVGCAILICMLKPDHIYASVIHEGHGYVQCQHGLLSVPVPATSEILTKAGVSLQQIDVNGELVTPTGAAIISELAESFGTMPQMKVEKIGWGAGTKDFGIPNVLKVTMGRIEDQETSKECHDGEMTQQPFGEQQIQEDVWTCQILTDEICVLETNLDDCTGEMMGYAMNKLLEAGALDVCYEPIIMKKNRPAYRLTVLARPQDRQKMEDTMFRYTTTIGIRWRMEQRSILKREAVTLHTAYGEGKGKKVEVQGQERVYPEYEDAVALAETNQVSLWEIYNNYGRK